MSGDRGQWRRCGNSGNRLTPPTFLATMPVYRSEYRLCASWDGSAAMRGDRS